MPTVRNRSTGAFSIIALIAVLFIFTKIMGVGYIETGSRILSFLSGTPIEKNSDPNALNIAASLVAIALIDLVISITIAVVVAKIIKLDLSTDITKMDPLFAKGPTVILKMLFLEEVFARWFFLGFLGKYLAGPTAFWSLVLVGNFLWAFLHYFNHPKEKRSLLLILPQFVGGLVLTYVFVVYGFWWCLFTHITYDAIIFAGHKIEEVSPIDLLNSVYYAIVGLACLGLLAFMGNSIADLNPWLIGDYSPIPGFNFWSYLSAITAIGCFLTIAGNLLLMDNYDITKTDRKYLNPLSGLLAVFLSPAVLLGFNWLLTWVIRDPFHRVVVLSVFFLVAKNTKTGSELARLWLTDLPSNYLWIAGAAVLGYWPVAGLVGISYLIDYLPKLLRVAEDETIRKRLAIKL